MIKGIGRFVVFAGLALMPAPSVGALCTATDTASLDQAIANTACATITLANDVTLTSDLSVLARDTTIAGNGHTLDGAGQFRALDIVSGTVAIGDLTIAHNVAQGGTSGGTGLGGGLFIGTATHVTTTNVQLSNNVAVGGSAGPGTVGSGGNALGGGVYVQTGGSLTTVGAFTLSGNQAVGGAGGNAAGGNAMGGGIYVQAGGGLVTVGAVTLTGNMALGGVGGNAAGGDALGGGIYAQQGDNVTIGNAARLSGNAATGGAGGNGVGGKAVGGGVFVNGGNVNFAPPAGVTQNVLDGIGGGGGVSKANAGTLIVSGRNAYVGLTLVGDGTLDVAGNNALGGGLVTVSPGALLNLNGTKQTVAALDLAGTLAVALGGTAAGQYGKLNVGGTATISGGFDTLLDNPFGLAINDQFDVVSFATLSGAFAGFAFENNPCLWTPIGTGGIADCGNGLSLSLSELAGNSPDPFYRLDVLSTAPAPEPGTLWLLGVGLGASFFMGRRPSRYAGGTGRRQTQPR